MFVAVFADVSRNGIPKLSAYARAFSVGTTLFA